MPPAPSTLELQTALTRLGIDRRDLPLTDTGVDRKAQACLRAATARRHHQNRHDSGIPEEIRHIKQAQALLREHFARINDRPGSFFPEGETHSPRPEPRPSPLPHEPIGAPKKDTPEPPPPPFGWEDWRLLWLEWKWRGQRWIQSSRAVLALGWMRTRSMGRNILYLIVLPLVTLLFVLGVLFLVFWIKTTGSLEGGPIVRPEAASPPYEFKLDPASLPRVSPPNPPTITIAGEGTGAMSISVRYPFAAPSRPGFVRVHTTPPGELTLIDHGGGMPFRISTPMIQALGLQAGFYTAILEIPSDRRREEFSLKVQEGSLLKIARNYKFRFFHQTYLEVRS